jgi:4a-hydroxytetrahydrobiopterin dehydratase
MSEWKETRDGITRTYSFKNYPETFGFAAQIALVAQRLNHHPKLIVEYNELTVETISHDVGKITDRDQKLVASIDELQLPAGKQNVEELKLIKSKLKKVSKANPKVHKKKLVTMKKKLNND